MANYEEAKESLQKWLSKPETIKHVHKRFETFLRHFKNEDGRYVYEERIHEMCRDNKQSLEINFPDLSSVLPTIAIWLAEEPGIMLNILNDVASDIVGEVYPDYHK
jgi:DNA replication licensing factor MCM2